jgi:hypothetical protein
VKSYIVQIIADEFKHPLRLKPKAAETYVLKFDNHIGHQDYFFGHITAHAQHKGQQDLRLRHKHYSLLQIAFYS